MRHRELKPKLLLVDVDTRGFYGKTLGHAARGALVQRAHGPGGAGGSKRKKIKKTTKVKMAPKKKERIAAAAAQLLPPGDMFAMALPHSGRWWRGTGGQKAEIEEWFERR